MQSILHKKVMKKFYPFVLLLTCWSYTFSQTLDKKYYITDNTVANVVQHGNTIYLGGRFTQVGPNTGHAALLDNNTGQWISGMPSINGQVSAIAADGKGGWYIGGTFDHVDDAIINNLVHIKADKTLDAAFKPQPNYAVNALAVYNNTLYVGGNFNNIAGQARARAAAFTISTGALTAWKPEPDNFIRSIIAGKDAIYLLGNFTNAGGQTRVAVAAVDATTGLANSLVITQNSSAGIGAIALLGDTLYLGGNFTTLNGVPRTELGAVNVKTGITTSWAPTADNAITAMYATKNKVFVSGAFDIVNGANHLHLAAFDPVSGEVSPWNAQVIGNGAFSGSIYSMTAVDNTLYVAGYFTSIGGQARANLAALNITTGAVTSWAPQGNNTAYAIAYTAGHFYAGGDFTSVNSVYRNAVAALDATTGKVTNWAPKLDGNVHGMAVKGDTVIIAGEFFNVGDSARHWLAGIDSATGIATGWNPQLFGRVYSIDVSGSNIYLGGNFSSIGGTDKYDVAAINADNNTVLPFSVDLNQSLNTVINGIKISGQTLYIWGAFHSVGDSTRNNIVAVDTATGKPTRWNPAPDATVNALAVSGTDVYIAGYFASAGGQSRSKIAKVNNTDGNALPWNPGIAGYSVNIIAIANNVVYAGGDFGSAGGSDRHNIASFNASTGALTDWKPATNYPAVNAIIPFGSKLLIGGGFTQFAYYSATGFAVAGQAITLPLQLVDFSAAAAHNNTIQLNWATANEVNTSHFTLQRSYDAVGFNDVTTITATGNAFNTYSYTDAAYKTGDVLLYYRLKMVDKDGTAAYSKTISLNIHLSADKFLLYPNPAHDQIGLNVNSTVNQKATLVITDMSGKVIQRESVQLYQGNNNVSVTLTNAAKGVYVAQLQLVDKKMSVSFLTY